MGPKVATRQLLRPNVSRRRLKLDSIASEQAIESASSTSSKNPSPRYRRATNGQIPSVRSIPKGSLRDFASLSTSRRRCRDAVGGCDRSSESERPSKSPPPNLSSTTNSSMGYAISAAKFRRFRPRRQFRNVHIQRRLTRQADSHPAPHEIAQNLVPFSRESPQYALFTGYARLLTNRHECEIGRIERVSGRHEKIGVFRRVFTLTHIPGVPY